MSNIKKGAKLTVSTGNGISRHTTPSLGILEVSGPAMSDTTADYTTNTAQLSIGATDVSGVLKLGINNDGNTFIDAIKHGTHTDIIMQKYGGDVIIGSGASSTSKVGIRTTNPRSTFDISSTDGLIIPVGTNGERPGTAYNGMIRYNTTTSQFEGYGPGSAWGSLGGVKDVDGDTYILAETSPTADNDDLQFFTGGQERMIVNLSGNVGIDTTNPRSIFDISSTDGLIIPVGTNGERPNPAYNGMIRYNTTTSQFEGYGPGSAWGSLGGVKDVDGDTYILAESSAGADNDDLQFFTAGQERMSINSVGDVSMNGDITTDVGYPYYQSLGTEKIVNPPSTTHTVHGVNITAMNKRTRASYASAEACVSTWTARSAGLEGWQSVCWSPELSIFVAVASAGSVGANWVMTSPDGITWTARSAAENNGWYSVCWSPELSIFVAVAFSGTNRVMTSPNGITWTARSAAENNGWRGVCWSPELSIFVAMAESGTNRVMTSSDGITWTARSAPSSNWQSVCWSPELSIFVAVAYMGTDRVMTSSDGITWTARSAAEVNGWLSICWSPELSIFVAVSYSGTNRIMTSPDGITWTARSAAEANNWRIVCWSPELSIFVAVAITGTNRIMTSPDGITWTGRSAAESNYWYSVCWSPELSIFVAVANTGTNRAMTSAIGMPNSKSVVKALPSQMSVDANGNVGIGTTTPYAKLIVQGTSEPTTGAGYTNTPANMAWPIVVNNVSAGFYNPSNAGYGCGIKFKQYFDNVNDQRWSGIAGVSQGQYSDYTGLTFYTCNDYIATEKMRILHNGNVGIGTSSPQTALQIGAEGTSDAVGSWGSHNIEAGSLSIINNNVSTGTDTKTVIDMARYGKSSWSYGSRCQIKIGRYDSASSGSPYYARTKIDFDLLDQNSSSSLNNVMSLQANGNVGIGIPNPTALLHINTNQTHSSSDFTSGYYLRSASSGGGAASAGLTYSSTWSAYPLSILAEGGVYAKTGYIVASDKRIKDKIVDVPDNSLQMVRDIPCRYYEYIDKARRGAEKTIGFIAQEVAEVLPMAISIQKDIIPNEMRTLTDISWNGNTLHTDLQDVSGVKYRFYVNNDVSGNDEIKKEIIGNSDNSFTFDNSYNNVFCYGKEVDDFHTLDKNKLFALNFSATQEIDRIQQQHIIDISNAQATIQSHETTIQTLQTDLSTTNTTIQQQATTIQQHETIIQQQQQQIADILSRLESLESSA